MTTMYNNSVNSNVNVSAKAPGRALPVNFMEILFAAMIYGQQTTSNQQMVGSKTSLSLSEVMAKIMKALDPTNPNGIVKYDLAKLSSYVDEMKGGDDKYDPVRSANITKWQNQLQADATNISNHQNQAGSSADQVNNRVQQDNTDLTQKLGAFASVIGVGSMLAQLLASGK